ncbi:MAG: hypothetical protein NZN28_06645 [Meiothermus sp.]|uniref:hypothetical protein n=1 Tax=Meiothermus sp. TaxID=1955249 RepID=UPI0025E10201|nr:hypothetical protein [Meiothermus sp.]MCS7068293.1 hypothetical protein [Meiothermus sp.]
MTEFYSLPNTGEFWHWTNALHFVLVGLAGGMALLAAILTLRQHPERNRYLWLAALLIVLDLFVLWAESPARWRFSHVWLFLGLHPSAPIWWGAWGLALSLVATLAVVLKPWVGFLRRIPEQLPGLLLLLGSLVALAYPGFALAVNTTRPLWNSMMLFLFPITALLMVLAVALLLGSEWARRWESWAAVLSLGLLVAYPFTLPEAARTHLLHEGLLGYALAGLLIAVAALLFRNPRWAAALGLAGAVGLRWVLVMVGQFQSPGL